MLLDLGAVELLHELGLVLLHSLWQGALVAGLLAVVLLFLRGRGAELRYFVCCSALVVMALLPVVTLRAVLESPKSTIEGELSASEATQSAALLDAAEADLAAVETAAPVEDSPSTELGNDALPIVPEGTRLVLVLEWMLAWLVVAWFVGVLLLSVRLIGQYAYACRFRSRLSRPAPVSWVADLQRLSTRLAVERRVTLLVSNVVDSPSVIGMLRPVIILPTSALTGLTSAQLEAILAHELAHIRRHDYLVNLLQSVVETLLFFNPAVWWVSNRIRVERENCCDDIAVSVSGSPVAYARVLTELEGLRSARSSLTVAADGGELMNRVRRLLGLSPSTSRDVVPWFAGILSICSLALLSAAVALGAFAQAQEEADSHDAYDHSQSRILYESAVSRSLYGTLDPAGEFVTDDRIYEFMSSREYSTGALPPGFNLAEAGIESPSFRSFPEGRQFVYVDTLAFPVPNRADRTFADSPYLLSADRTFAPFGDAADNFADKLHVLLTAPETEYAREVRGTVFPKSLEALADQSGVEVLNGRWALWLDAAGAVKEATTPNYPEARPETRSYRPFYACVEDGRVVSAYSDVQLATIEGRVEGLAEACLQGDVREANAAFPYLSEGSVPEFTLQAENGSPLRPAELPATPFAVFALPPGGPDSPVDPARLLEAAEGFLERLEQEMPVYVLALPHPGTSAEQVAASLREQLEVPVYEDIEGNFVNTLSNYLQLSSPLLVFNSSGGIVDGFFPWRIGDPPSRPRPFTLKNVLSDQGIE